ncbi:hypothetical protein Q0Z83_042810 [Actinoplanes sichuanensis]|uniref:Tetratricopeptide repeat protein n=1 Tax=Actinoplanes sichuanensis TaxID=512349 RepID=A0ABW4ASL3_9ACTN|nr:hypothetical protein [Actinoplanes sichuanensis]BEL06090.1 hypothetical protein Q0Z83_042810 [Actinoplanes sichuanensis]
MHSVVVDHALKILDRFTTDDPPTASAEERTAWAEALLDSGDPTAAAEQLITVLRAGPTPDTLPEVARRLPWQQARSVLAAAIDNGRVTREISLRPQLGSGFARLAAGSDEAEEALLRAVLAVEQYEESPPYGPHRERKHRVAAVVAALAEAHPGEPERLDLWASILGAADRPRLAAAARLLAPLGLAEIDRRCGELDADTEGTEGVGLARALAEAGRLTEALELAARLQPDPRQAALLAMAEVVTGEREAKAEVRTGEREARAEVLTGEREAKAVVAAFRACPKGGRDRHQQLAYQHRLTVLLLSFGRVDDALAELSKMCGRPFASSAPIRLAEEIVDRLGRRPEPVTDERLRTLLDALDTANLRPYELSLEIADLLHGVFVLAGPDLRAEILSTRAATIRTRLATHGSGHVDIGLAAGLIAIGRAGEAAAHLRTVSAATPARRYGFTAELLIAAAADTDLPEYDPDLFAEVYGMIADLAAYPPPQSSAPAIALGPAGRATAARLTDRFRPNRLPRRLTGWLAEAAARTGDFDTLGILLEKATDEPQASLAARHLAAALARYGDRAGADAVADACGLSPTSPTAG